MGLTAELADGSDHDHDDEGQHHSIFDRGGAGFTSYQQPEAAKNSLQAVSQR